MLFIFSHGLLSTVFRNKKYDEIFLIDLATRFVGLVHTLYICFYVYSYFLNYISLDYFLSKLYFTESFLIYDAIIMIIFRNKIKDWKSVLAHHVAFYFTLRLTPNKNLIPYGLLAETTNPFLYTSWYFYKTGKIHKKRAKICNMLFYIGFFFFRIVNFGYLIYLMLFHVDSILIEKVGFTGLYGLNLNWFRLLTYKLFKVINT